MRSVDEEMKAIRCDYVRGQDVSLRLFSVIDRMIREAKRQDDKIEELRTEILKGKQ